MIHVYSHSYMYNVCMYITGVRRMEYSSKQKNRKYKSDVKGHAKRQ